MRIRLKRLDDGRRKLEVNIRFVIYEGCHN